MQTLIDPAILFFVFGVLAGLVKSNLEIPPAISRFLSLYLLMALGLKGGFALAQSGLTTEVATGLSLAITLALLVPVLSYAVLSRFLSGFDAAAVAVGIGLQELLAGVEQPLNELIEPISAARLLRRMVRLRFARRSREYRQ